MPEPTNCGLILLAAGASQRMGRPKQLLPVNGNPLVRHVAEAVLAAPVSPVIVVLGAHAAEVASALDGLAVQVVINQNWVEGMGSSLRAGVKAALGLAPQLSNLIIALADQPNLSAAHLERLMAAQRQTGRSMVASESEGVLQPPALFAAAHFPQLLALRGDIGARSLFQSAGETLAVVSAGEMPDLDTPADYAGFIRRRDT